MHFETVWAFETPRTCVSLLVAPDHNYFYDGDDPDGEVQAALDSGRFVAFDSIVRVEVDGHVIAEDHLGGSVYDADEVSQFWTDHRCADPMNRNCSIMRAARGDNVVLCHYFPDMVRAAAREARKALANPLRLRAA